MIGRVMAGIFQPHRDIRCPGGITQSDRVEVREGRIVHVISRAEFDLLVEDHFFRDDSIWREYWEDSFRWVYPRS